MAFSCINDKLGNLSIETLIRNRSENRSGLSSMLNALTQQNKELEEANKQLHTQLTSVQEENNALRTQLARQHKEIEEALNQSLSEDCFGLETSITQLRLLVQNRTQSLAQNNVLKESYLFKEELKESQRQQNRLQQRLKSQSRLDEDVIPDEFDKEVDVWVDQLLLFFKTKVNAVSSSQHLPDFLALDVALPLSKRQQAVISDILHTLLGVREAVLGLELQEKKYLHTIQRLSAQVIELRAQVTDSPRTVRDPLFYSDSEYSEFIQPLPRPR